MDETALHRMQSHKKTSWLCTQYNIDKVCVYCVHMMLKCLACGHKRPSSRAIRCDALSARGRRWLSPGAPLQEIYHRYKETRSGLQCLNRNSTRSRRWRDRRQAAQHDDSADERVSPPVTDGRATVYGHGR